MFLSLNFVDDFIFLFVFFYAFFILKRGFLANFFEFVGFFGSLLTAMIFFAYPSLALQRLSLPLQLANTFSFLFIWVSVEMLSLFLLRDFFKKIPMSLILSKFNRYWAIFPNLASSLTIVIFIGLIAISLPSSENLKNQIIESRTLGTLLPFTSQFNLPLEKVFSQSVRDTLVLINKKGEERFVKLSFPKVKIQIDTSSEQTLFTLTNSFRVSNSLPSLVYDPSLTEAARIHSLDMFERNYFGHFDPDNKNPYQRAKAEGLVFNVLGENISYAPDVESAQLSFINSPGHRDNILNKRFHKVGIGVAESNSYGKMFTELFSD